MYESSHSLPTQRAPRFFGQFFFLSRLGPVHHRRPSRDRKRPNRSESPTSSPSTLTAYDHRESKHRGRNRRVIDPSDHLHHLARSATSPQRLTGWNQKATTPTRYTASGSPLDSDTKPVNLQHFPTRSDCRVLLVDRLHGELIRVYIPTTSLHQC